MPGPLPGAKVWMLTDDRARVIQGLGGFLVGSGEQRAVYRLSGVTRIPVVLARG